MWCAAIPFSLNFISLVILKKELHGWKLTVWAQTWNRSETRFRWWSTMIVFSSKQAKHSVQNTSLSDHPMQRLYRTQHLHVMLNVLKWIRICTFTFSSNFYFPTLLTKKKLHHLTTYCSDNFLPTFSLIEEFFNLPRSRHGYSVWGEIKVQRIKRFQSIQMRINGVLN